MEQLLLVHLPFDKVALDLMLLHTLLTINNFMQSQIVVQMLTIMMA